MIHGWAVLWRLEDDFSPDEIWVFFDGVGATRREASCPIIKPTGVAPRRDLTAYMKQLTGAMGMVGRKRGVEADDLIATKTKN